jgi:hypothetical protein
LQQPEIKLKNERKEFSNFYFRSKRRAVLLPPVLSTTRRTTRSRAQYQALPVHRYFRQKKNLEFKVNKHLFVPSKLSKKLNFKLTNIYIFEWGSGDRISRSQNRRSKVFMIRRSNNFASFQEIKTLSVAKLQN